MVDDDKKFEGALAGFLHREKRDSERHVFCPEPELLAAYYDRTLSPAEIQVARLHVEGCSRCHEVLAQLKKTEELPLVAAPADKPDAIDAPPLTFPGSAAPLTNRSRWRWIAPAAALAASLVLWLAYQQQRSTKVSSVDSVQVAENRTEADAPEPVPQPPVEQSNPALQEPASGLDSKSPNQMEPRISPQVAHPRPAAKTRNTQKSNLPAHVGQLPRSDSESRAIEKFSTDSAVSTAKGKTPSLAAAPGPPPNVGSAVTAQVPMAASRLKKRMATQLRAGNNSVIIGTAGTAVWRVGAAGSIEVSVDGGNNWHAQISGVTADLSAGSAPLPSICWVVGRSGTILLTTDSGATWRNIKAPTGKDIVGVRALDASSATVWDVSTEKFVTADAGLTWKRVVSE